MASAGINFSGLASGLDTKAIISALVNVERQPILLLEDKKTLIGKQKSLFGDLSTLLGTLSDTAKALKRTTDFLVMKTTTDDANVLTADASSSAVPGSHRVDVVSLATAQVNTSNGHADKAAQQYGNSVFLLTVGTNTTPISVPSNDGSLEGVARAINGANAGVAAEVVDTGQGTNRYQLVVRSQTTGAAGDFSLQFDSGTANASALADELNLAANQRTAGADAHIKLNGIDVYRASNTISDAIPGVTLNLKSVPSPQKTITVTIAADAEETSKKVSAFVDAYNKVVDFFQTQNALDGNGKAQSPLFGDSTLRTIRSGLRTDVGSIVGSGAYSMLAQIGITSDRQGKLTFNQSAFVDALGHDEQAVTRVFADTQGVAQKLAADIDVYTNSTDGLLKTRSDGLDSLSKQTQQRIDEANRRLDQYQQQLQTKFANLESMLSQLQGQGSALNSTTSVRR